MTPDKIKAIREALEVLEPVSVGQHSDDVNSLSTRVAIAAFRSHLPGLLDELESLRAENEELKRQVELSAYDGMGEDV